MQLILGLFKLLGGLLVLLLRLALPIAVIVFAIWLIRRGASGGTKHDTGGAAPRRDPKPHFKGPVMPCSARAVTEGTDPTAGRQHEKHDDSGEGRT